MNNQLIFVPRRGRVWLAKAITAVLGSAVIAALALALFWGLLWLTAYMRNIETSRAFWHDVGGMAGRTVALAAGAAMGGYALTMLFRNTVATLGLLFAASVVGSILVELILIAGIRGWSIGPNVSGELLDGATYYDHSMCRNGAEDATSSNCSPSARACAT